MFSTVNYTKIGDLYSSDPSQRYQLILDTFNKLYGEKPEFIARAPGRVNIIGEHIDYEGYGVLPAAIEKDCLIAVRKTQSKEIRINHIHPEVYPSTAIPVDPEAEVHFTNNYVKYFRAGYRAGVKGLKVE
jgi:galactokinase